MAKQTFMSRVKAYRKLHPRTSQVDAMKKLAGTKPKTTAKKLTPRKKSITKTERITTVGARKAKSNPLTKGIAISKKINELELLLKAASGTTAKNKIKRLINAEHDKLDLLTEHI